ncbi:hypothetical protein LSM04_000942 [Trypanosoma melophagium]|uniref:uncharacterized protein n=1 Tax=Trypanosoma melophagium TaxID=715481 RepID=UPI00351A222B|nr:hypothetical protein LSM04_000942 [Trypanosoma melophagium]
MGQSSSNNSNSNINSNNNKNNSTQNHNNSSTSNNNSNNNSSTRSSFFPQRRGGRPPVMIPAEPVDVHPTPLPLESPNNNNNNNNNNTHLFSSSSSWLSATEARLTREWLAGRRRQADGVSATSPHVPLTCAAAAFPANRTTAILHPNTSGSGGELRVTELPVGKEYFLALRSAWRAEAAPRDVLPQTDERELDDSFIHDAIEDAVGAVLTPPVPLAYMVGEILVPQWELEGLYDAPALRNNP